MLFVDVTSQKNLLQIMIEDERNDDNPFSLEKKGEKKETSITDTN